MSALEQLAHILKAWSKRRSSREGETSPAKAGGEGQRLVVAHDIGANGHGHVSPKCSGHRLIDHGTIEVVGVIENEQRGRVHLFEIFQALNLERDPVANDPRKQVIAQCVADPTNISSIRPLGKVAVRSWRRTITNQ